MKRVILTPAVLAPAALAELKQWLGISTSQDDGPLTALLRAALDLCESFTGTMPLNADCEEVLPVTGGWQALATQPVLAITAIEAILADGTRSALPITAWSAELDADGSGRVRVASPGNATRLAVRFSAGLAPGWPTLPEALRHGVMRLAAYQHRQRDNDGAGPLPPAAVAALWRPWRRVRLA